MLFQIISCYSFFSNDEITLELDSIMGYFCISLRIINHVNKGLNLFNYNA